MSKSGNVFSSDPQTQDSALYDARVRKFWAYQLNLLPGGVISPD
jgi:hypothetical protein